MLKNFKPWQRAVMITVVIVAQIAIDALAKYLVRTEVRLEAEKDHDRAVPKL